MSVEYCAGAIFHYEGFAFADGSGKNKFLIVLGVYSNGDCLYALTTSRRKRKGDKIGCTQRPYTYFFIAGDGKNFFKKDTWILLSDSVVMSKIEFLQGALNKKITFRKNLRQSITDSIYECLKNSADVSPKLLQNLVTNKNC